MDKKTVPLLTAEDANTVVVRYRHIPDQAMIFYGAEIVSKVAAIASGDAVVVPKGMREAVEKVVAEMLDYRSREDGFTTNIQTDKWADRLQRALNGEKA